MLLIRKLFESIKIYADEMNGKEEIFSQNTSLCSRHLMKINTRTFLYNDSSHSVLS